MNAILSSLLTSLPPGQTEKVSIGLHWTAVVAQSQGETRCGLASTLHGSEHHRSEPDVPQAGKLESLPIQELASLVNSGTPTQVSVGLAAINALLPPVEGGLDQRNAEDLIVEKAGEEGRVTLVGHFPFTGRLRQRVSHLDVLELNPQPGDLPASAASQVIPQADVVAITSMTLMNGSLQGLLDDCSPQAYVLLLGPSTPLSASMFEFGLDCLCGAQVEDVDAVLRALVQGANFHQLHRAGVRLVNLFRSA